MGKIRAVGWGGGGGFNNNLGLNPFWARSLWQFAIDGLKMVTLQRFYTFRFRHIKTPKGPICVHVARAEAELDILLFPTRFCFQTLLSIHYLSILEAKWNMFVLHFLYIHSTISFRCDRNFK